MKNSIVKAPGRISRRQCLLGAAAGGLASTFGVSAGAAVTKGERVEWPPVLLLDGRKIEPADWKGKAAVVVFWSVDCAYCRRHNARLDKLYRELQASGSKLQILGVATDTDAQAVRSFLLDKDYRFPVTLDKGLRAQLTERKVVPMTVLIDRQGLFLMAIPGEMSEDDLLGLARQLG